jgi:dihydrofolate synthase / folylpolyglutamate synthase
MGLVDSTLVCNDEGESHTPRYTTLQDWLSWQEGLHFTAIDLGLDRCRSVAERMGLLAPEFAVINVAGTNGKGSSVTMLDMILRKSSYSIGRYTSPHLIHYNERICVNGQEVSDELLCESFDRIDRARGDISLTYFEFGTLAALDIFRKFGIQIAILEVGLGGRLDAVNILDADASLVASIDVDHEAWLGNDRESIGREKAGIFRPGKAAVCSDPMPPLSVTDYAESIGVDLKLLGKDFSYEVIADAWNWQSGPIKYHALAKPSANNDCQIQNAAGVLMLLKTIADRFPVSYDAVTTTMKDFQLNGRFQIVPGEPCYVLDVAHNRQAAELLVKNLNKLPKANHTHCVVGMLKDKNHEQIFYELGKIVDSWYVTELNSDRAAKISLLKDKLVEIVNPENLYEFNDINMALELAANRAQPGDRILVTGSFLTVRAGILWLQIEK